VAGGLGCTLNVLVGVDRRVDALELRPSVGVPAPEPECADGTGEGPLESRVVAGIVVFCVVTRVDTGGRVDGLREG
jgi:hypothetical protein